VKQMRRYGVFVLLASLVAGATPASGKKSVRIVVQGDPAPQLKIGTDAITAAAAKKGITVSDKSNSVKIVLEIETGGKKPESYEITSSPTQIQVKGSDATGAMYGAFEVAEQLEAASDLKNPLASIRSVSHAPYLEIRGENIFITTQDINDSESSFWSDAYWQIYLDMLARDRYNLLDIHGPCDAVSLDFPNAFAYFVTLPEFPEIGVGAEKAAKNMARLRWVIQQASDRGIKVAYMNYEASAPIGPWRSRKFGVDERWTPMPQEFLSGERLEQYTRHAVSLFLRDLPELWMFGFRIGESGQPEDFYKKTYLAALAEAAPSLKIYIRTWVADPKKVRELADSTHHAVYIEPKYNGEQLGLPYQAAQGGREYPPSGSYEDYTNYPRKYSILWQIRAHGTSRVFHWAWPEFARRTVRSCKFGEGVGFSMESMNAYLPSADYLHHNPKTDHHFYKWMIEREWAWHMVWGRTAYDPDVPEQVFTQAYVERFGAEAGPLVFNALTESSKIVPFVYSYHNIGLDHQDFAPEFETGDHAFGIRSRLWQGTRLVPHGGNNDDFLRVRPLDRTAMADPASYVEDYLKGQATGKMSPFEAADYLDRAAEESEEVVEKAASINPQSSENFDCIKMDIEAVASLGRYYANRIRSVTHLAFYYKSQDHMELTQAGDYLTRAVADWDRLSDITDNHFGYVPEYIRMGVKEFRWRDEGRSLGADLEQLNALEGEFRKVAKSEAYHTVLGHSPAFKAKPGSPLSVQVTYVTQTGNPKVDLFYRNSQQLGYTRLPMKYDNEAERKWKVEIPAQAIVPGFVEYYFEAAAEPWGPYGGTLLYRPPYRVLVNQNELRPVISVVAPDPGDRSDRAKLTVHVEAKSKIAVVRAYYKPMPASYEWMNVNMKSTGEGNFTGVLPLTSEGIIYYFEAVDEDGNGTNYPNFLEKTPYLWISGWAPQNSR
jgi:hypothetical protein